MQETEKTMERQEEFVFHEQQHSQGELNRGLSHAKSKSNIKLNPIRTEGEEDLVELRQHIVPPITPKSNSKIERKDSQVSPLRRKKIPKGYEMARQNVALEYLHTQRYLKKTSSTLDGGDEYYELEVCGSNDDFKEYGLGVYLYFQFLRRLIITFFLMTVIEMWPIFMMYKGDGLQEYSFSYTILMAKTTVGNLSNADRQTYLVVTIGDILSIVVLFIFYLTWRSFHKSALEEQDKDFKVVNPKSYVVSVVDFSDEATNIKNLQAELKSYFDILHKGAYEVEVVYNYNGNFEKFLEYDQMIEQIEKEHQVIKQTNKSTDHLVKLQNEVNQFEKQLASTSQSFDPSYAIIHFRTLKNKLAFINHCKKYKLIDTFTQKFSRCFCCTPNPPERQLFLNKHPIMIKSATLSRPQEINWRNIDLSGFSVAFRWFCSLFFLVVVIIITSATIGFMTIYVASRSSCKDYDGDTQTAATATAKGGKTLYCYCNDNFSQMFSDPIIQAACSDVSNQIFITNALLVGASIVSAATNAILAIIVTFIAQKLLRPNTIPKQYKFVYYGVLVATLINSIIIPLMLNANIFGLESVEYLKWVNITDPTQLSVFDDFTKDWYANISPYYVNFVIIAILIPPINLFVYWVKNTWAVWRARKWCENSKEDPKIQKQVNKKISSVEFLYAEEQALIVLYLFIVLMYSGIIPVLVPIFFLALVLWYFCKRTAITKYTVRVPADESLNESILSILPLIILMHTLFALWGHTTPGTFAEGASLVTLDFTFFNNKMDRVFGDVMMLGELVLILLFIILDFTIFNFFGCLQDCCCKDELQMPLQLAGVENTPYDDRIRKTNILGSYKLINNPTYGHAIKAYRELLFRNSKQKDQSDSHNPQRFD